MPDIIFVLLILLFMTYWFYLATKEKVLKQVKEDKNSIMKQLLKEKRKTPEQNSRDDKVVKMDKRQCSDEMGKFLSAVIIDSRIKKSKKRKKEAITQILFISFAVIFVVSITGLSGIPNYFQDLVYLAVSCILFFIASILSIMQIYLSNQTILSSGEEKAYIKEEIFYSVSKMFLYGLVVVAFFWITIFTSEFGFGK